MRYRDLILEAATPETVHRIKQEIEQRHYVFAGIGAGEERNPDGLPEDEIIAILIDDAELNLSRLGPIVYAYRAVSLTELSRLRTDHLGQSWSLEEAMALPYRGDQQRFYRLTGQIQKSDIDLEETILMQVAYEEQEVVLKVGSPVVIEEIMLCTPVREQSVESPLIGRTMRA